MEAEFIYNKAQADLIDLATQLLSEITEKIKSEKIDITIYDVDLTNVIVWGEDVDGILAKGFDIEVIYFDGKNIEIYNEEEEYRNFFELPLNSMVFVINGLKEILKQTNRL